MVEVQEIFQKYERSKQKSSKPYVLWQLEFARIYREKGGFDVVVGNDSRQLVGIIDGIQFGATDQCDTVTHKFGMKVAVSICGTVRRHQKIGTVEIGSIHRYQLYLYRPLGQAARDRWGRGITGTVSTPDRP